MTSPHTHVSHSLKSEINGVNQLGDQESFDPVKRPLAGQELIGAASQDSWVTMPALIRI